MQVTKRSPEAKMAHLREKKRRLHKLSVGTKGKHNIHIVNTIDGASHISGDSRTYNAQQV